MPFAVPLRYFTNIAGDDPVYTVTYKVVPVIGVFSGVTGGTAGTGTYTFTADKDNIFHKCLGVRLDTDDDEYRDAVVSVTIYESIAGVEKTISEFIEGQSSYTCTNLDQTITLYENQWWSARDYLTTPNGWTRMARPVLTDPFEGSNKSTLTITVPSAYTAVADADALAYGCFNEAGYPSPYDSSDASLSISDWDPSTGIWTTIQPGNVNQINGHFAYWFAHDDSDLTGTFEFEVELKDDDGGSVTPAHTLTGTWTVVIMPVDDLPYFLPAPNFQALGVPQYVKGEGISVGFGPSSDYGGDPLVEVYDPDEATYTLHAKAELEVGVAWNNGVGDYAGTLSLSTPVPGAEIDGYETLTYSGTTAEVNSLIEKIRVTPHIDLQGALSVGFIVNAPGSPLDDLSAISFWPEVQFISTTTATAVGTGYIASRPNVLALDAISTQSTVGSATLTFNKPLDIDAITVESEVAGDITATTTFGLLSDGPFYITGYGDVLAKINYGFRLKAEVEATTSATLTKFIFKKALASEILAESTIYKGGSKLNYVERLASEILAESTIYKGGSKLNYAERLAGVIEGEATVEPRLYRMQTIAMTADADSEVTLSKFWRQSLVDFEVAIDSDTTVSGDFEALWPDAYFAAITYSSEAANDELGTAVAVSNTDSSGDYYIVGGAPGADSDKGAVYVWKYNSTSEQSETKIQPSGLGADWLGSSVAINSDGDTIAMGAPYAGNGTYGGGVGDAYIWTRSGSTWTQQDEIEYSAGESSTTRYGCSIAISNSGDRVAVRSWSDVSIFDRSGTTWSLEEEVTFIWPYGQVAISGDGNYVIVGANGTAQVRKVSDSTTTIDYGSSIQYGHSVAIDNTGTYAAVGDHDISSATSGKVHIWKRTGTSWSMEQTITPPISSAIGFGVHTTLSHTGNNLIISAYREDMLPAYVQLRTFSYVLLNGEFVYVEQLTDETLSKKGPIAVASDARTFIAGDSGHNSSKGRLLGYHKHA